MEISTAFDGGNIEIVDASNQQNIQLQIRPDHQSEFYQWFYFRVTGVKDLKCRYRIVNAAGAAYPNGFKNYRVCYSYDRETWLRHDTSLEDGELKFEFSSANDSVYFAYFAPYPMERHHKLVARAQSVEHCVLTKLGQTLDGQDFDQLTFSNSGGADRFQCWIIARQHPGETMAEWWMEGCVNKLLDTSSELTQALLDTCDIHLVSNMNPDGSLRGHLRTNAAGRNLNREWAEPSLEHSPEVFLVKQAMAKTGVDFLLDVHGDEAIPAVFLAGYEGIPDLTEDHLEGYNSYQAILDRRTPDFQTKLGYPKAAPGKANLSMCTTQVAHRFNATAMTLEMPYKDLADAPEPEQGWSPERCKLLGRECMAALLEWLDR